MNVGPTPSNAAPPREPTAQSAQCRRDAPPRSDERGQRDAFERALLARALPAGSGDSDHDEPVAAEPATPDGSALPPAWVPPLVRHADAPPVAAGVVAEAATGTRAAIEAALQHAEPPVAPALPGSERPSVWEASVGGPHGTVDVRAERTVASPGSTPTWGVTVAAPTLGADLATRHAPKLHERLRKHGIDVDHVRVEGRGDADDQPR